MTETSVVFNPCSKFDIGVSKTMIPVQRLWNASDYDRNVRNNIWCEISWQNGARYKMTWSGIEYGCNLYQHILNLFFSFIIRNKPARWCYQTLEYWTIPNLSDTKLRNLCQIHENHKCQVPTKNQEGLWRHMRSNRFEDCNIRIYDTDRFDIPQVTSLIYVVMKHQIRQIRSVLDLYEQYKTRLILKGIAIYILLQQNFGMKGIETMTV